LNQNPIVFELFKIKKVQGNMQASANNALAKGVYLLEQFIMPRQE
jgi:hypothetical protein